MVSNEPTNPQSNWNYYYMTICLESSQPNNTLDIIVLIFPWTIAFEPVMKAPSPEIFVEMCKHYNYYRRLRENWECEIDQWLHFLKKIASAISPGSQFKLSTMDSPRKDMWSGGAIQKVEIIPKKDQFLF